MIKGFEAYYIVATSKMDGSVLHLIGPIHDYESLDFVHEIFVHNFGIDENLIRVEVVKNEWYTIEGDV